MRAGLVISVVVLACSCGDDEPMVDGRPARLDAPPPPTERLVIEATQASYANTFGIDLAGQGTAPVGTVSIQNGFGTVEIDGEALPTAVYEQQPWPQFNYTLYQALAIAPDRWYVLWFYCQAGQIATIWVEGTSGPALDHVASQGSCNESNQPQSVSATFPAGNLAVPPLVPGFEVEGDDLSIPDGAPGMARIGGVEMRIYAFGTVDCSEVCGSPGWYELHALLWDPEIESLCFGIFYLYPGIPTVNLEYSFSLPVLRDPFGSVAFAASFNHF